MVDTTKNTKLFTSYGVSTSKTVAPEMAAKLISKAKRPLLMVGTLALDPEILDRVVKISKTANIPIAATGSSLAALADKDVDAKYINAHIEEIIKSANTIMAEGKKILDSAIIIKETHINTLINKIANFKITKIIKTIENLD